MKKLMLVIFVVLLAAGLAAAQTYTAGSGLTGKDVLGAHNNGGRGCAGCHAPHSGAAGGGGNAGTYTGTNTDPLSGTNALFGQDVAPLLNTTLTFAGGYVEQALSDNAAYTTNQDELRGILMCLACHDGQIAKGQMMTGWSWEKTLGLLPSGVYGPNRIPTLLGNDSGDGNTSGYGNDHPVGVQATLGALHLVSANGGKGTDPLKVTVDTTNGVIADVVPQSAQYTQFVANYGYPAIAGTTWDWGFHLPSGVTDASQAFMTCTTCHNQHVMYVYQGPTMPYGADRSGAKQLNSAIGTGTYPTYFFVNGAYNPGAGNNDATKAASTTQFCRECHFTGAANESFGVNNVQTQF